MSLLLAVLALHWPRAAHAYLDPGSGSLVLQALLAGVAGVAVVLKMYWKRLAGRFRGRKGDRR